jgi:hypothetical protein
LPCSAVEDNAAGNESHAEPVGQRRKADCRSWRWFATKRFVETPMDCRCTVSKPNLIRHPLKEWRKIGRYWQDDGAVVEQFRISNIDKMMAFDLAILK